MRFSYWNNPHRRNSDRVYINGLKDLKKGDKVWIQQGRGTSWSFKANNDDLNLEALEFQVIGQLVDLGVIGASESPTFQSFVEAGNKSSSPRPKRPAQPAYTPTMTTVDRETQAQQLDLSSIPVPSEVKIVIDHREPDELVRAFDGLENVTVSVESLPLGDILINDCIIVERKRCTSSPTDFEASIIDAEKRLFNQSTRMGFEDAMGVFLIEGNVFANSTRMDLIQSIDGALSYLVAIQQMSVLTTYNLRHTAYTILKLGAFQKDGLFNPITMRANKPKTTRPATLYFLEGLPGVNTGIAEAMLDHFGSVKAMANATIKELKEVPGVGAKKAERIHAVLNGDGDSP